ncbi:MAG: Lrp/AsnC family transcriptional regulator [Candidatus Hodarchaeota archaeon]
MAQFRREKIIDEKDELIIKLLKHNPKMSHQTIADKLDVARQTVQKRIKKLEESGIIRFAVITDDKKLGKDITAFILIEIGSGKGIHGFHGLHDELKLQMDELDILEFHHVAGQEDIILKMRTQNIDSFESNLVKIAGMEGVSRTRSMICTSSIEDRN